MPLRQFGAKARDGETTGQPLLTSVKWEEKKEAGRLPVWRLLRYEKRKKTAVVRFCGSNRVCCVKTQGLINRFSRDDVFDVSHLPELAD